MDLEARLRAFAAFARRRSFSAAAQELRISQPAVSKHVADVERDVRVRLVARRPRGGELTPAGEFLANHVLRAQALLAQAARGIAAFREPGTGSLAIVASGVPGTYLVPEVVAGFQRVHPGVRVTIELATSVKAVESLRSHRAELGVVGGFAAAPGIEAELLVEDEIVVVGPPELAGRTMSRKEAEATTWISREEGSASRAAIEAAWADSGITPSRHLELPILGGGEARRLPGRWRGRLQSVRGRGRATGRLSWLVRLRGWNVRRTISIIRLRDAASTPAARELVTMLHARWGRKPPGPARRP